MIAVSLGGWLAASGTGVLAGAVWRALTGRMESVARACHELRGPLTAARLGLQLGASTGELSPARLRAIDLELGRAALALEDLDRVRANGTSSFRAPAPVDLAEVAAALVEAWRPCAAGRGAELRLCRSGPRAIVWGESLRLAQALGNLIANAIEHGGGVVEVHVASDVHRARVEVVDDGPGLPAPLSKVVGQRGRRGRGRGRRGRGLAIAQSIAEQHGGRLAAVPSTRGARLVLTLPPASSV